MEIKFEEKSIRFLKNAVAGCKAQEQTQEIRLPENMPDIDCVLGAWGQTVVRSKQWVGNIIEASCNAMVWVLYKAEDTGEINCVEALLPFQFAWDIPNYETDGHINISTHIANISARTTSSRKIIVRASINAIVDATIIDETVISVPAETESAVQCLKREFVFMLPKEAGEKVFSLDEELSIPSSYPEIDKILKYQIHLEVTDKKIITQKVVFRGTAIVYITYLSKDGNLCNWEGEIPFSQYSDLDMDYDDNAYIRTEPELSGVEIVLSDVNKISVSAGVVFQYLVFGKERTEIIEDAYCPGLESNTHQCYLQIPVLLDKKEELCHIEHFADVQTNRIVDVAVWPGKPIISKESGTEGIMIPCEMTIIYYDLEGNLQSKQMVYQKKIDSGVTYDGLMCRCSLSSTPRATIGVSGCNISYDLILNCFWLANESIPMVDRIETSQLDSLRKKPSIVLCRRNDDTLWTIGKRYGSAVDDILCVNNLHTEPAADQMLVIPIL